MNDFVEYCTYMYDNRECATCKHCGHGIYKLPDRGGYNPWFHDAGQRRGCRAAAYDRDRGWKAEHDALYRKYATPAR